MTGESDVDELGFKIKRNTYDPKPVRPLAVFAKQEILEKGGEFFLISVNGLTSPEALVSYVIEKLNIPISIATRALDIMANSTIEGFDEVVSDVWAVVEEDDGEEVTKFVAFAFSCEEIEAKTNLFVEGIKQFKVVLTDYIQMRNSNRKWAEVPAAVVV